MFHEHEIPYYLFENANIAIAFVRDDKFVFVNKYAEIMTGYSSGELTSKDFVSFIHPDDRPLVYQRYLQRIKGEDAPISYEFRIIDKTGCCRWVEIKSSIITYDTGPATLCFLSDISERKIAEEALKNREAILKSIFDASDVGILVLKNRIMTKINSAFCKMTGYSEEDLQNKSTAMLYLDHNSFCQVGRDLCTISPNAKIETLMKKKNGTLFNVRITSSWLDPKDVEAGMCLTVMDISIDKLMQAKLEKSEKRYRDLSDFLPQIVYETDNEGTLTYVNERWYSSFGYSPEDVTRGINALELIMGKDSVLVRDSVEKAARSGTGLNIECNAVRKNGLTFPVLAFMAPVVQGNAVAGFRNLMVDITQQKQLENQRNEAMQTTLDIIEFLPDPTFVIDNKSNVVAWNKAIEELTGVKKEDILGRGEYAYAVPFYGKPRPILIDQIYESNDGFETKYDYVNHENDKVLGEVFIPHFNDGKGVFLWGCACPLYSRQGMKIGAIESIRDITEIKKNEDLLRQSEARFRQFSDNVTDGFSIVDFQTKKCIFTNPAMDVIHGTSLTGKDLEIVLKIIHPEDRSMIANYLISEEKNELEYRIVRPDSNVRWIRTRKFTLTNETGKTIRMFGVSTDITEQKKALNEVELHRVQMIQADKLATLGILVSGVAHEINNPNNYLMLNSKIIKRIWHDIAPILEKHASENPKFKLAELEYREAAKLLPDIIEGLSDGTLKIKRIVDSLRDYARKEPPDFKQEVDINKIVESSLVLLSNMVKKVTDNFATHLMNELPLVIGSAQQLEQVVINLLSNSCQALTERGQRIDVHTFAEGNEVVLKLIDEGIGIAPENIGKIFDPFFTTKRDKGGTGLGLPISKNIINNHNGLIDFSSVNGKGTTVIVRLPSKPEKGGRKIV